MIDVRGPSPLWVVPPLGMWSCVVWESKMSKPWRTNQLAALPHSVCFSSFSKVPTLYFCSKFPQWWSVTWEPKDKISPFFLWVGSDLITAAERKLGHYLVGRKNFILAHDIRGFSFWQYVPFILTCGSIYNVFWWEVHHKCLPNLCWLREEEEVKEEDKEEEEK